MLWLSVGSNMQIICIWSSWCHCIPELHDLLPYLNPYWFYPSGTSLSKLSWKSGPLNRCSSSSRVFLQFLSCNYGICSEWHVLLLQFFLKSFGHYNILMQVSLIESAKPWICNHFKRQTSQTSVLFFIILWIIATTDVVCCMLLRCPAAWLTHTRMTSDCWISDGHNTARAWAVDHRCMFVAAPVCRKS